MADTKADSPTEISAKVRKKPGTRATEKLFRGFSFLPSIHFYFTTGCRCYAFCAVGEPAIGSE